MEAIRYLIGFFLKIAIGAIFIALVWWLVSLLFPALSFSQIKRIVSGEQKKDILPSPRAYAKLVQQAPAPSATSNLYVHGQEFGGYGALDSNVYTYTPGGFVTYSYGNATTSTQKPQPGTAPQATPPSRSMYIRNLSIYEGGNISRDLTFIGEARNEMYKNGTFNILVVNKEGAVLGVSPVRATGAWSIPGWSRFEVTIKHTLPPGGVQCVVIFEQARTQADTQQPVRVGVPVRCN